MKKIICLSALALCAILIVISSCKKNNGDGDAIDTIPPTPTGTKATVTGLIIDENNNPLNGATVVIGSTTVTTNQFGIFVFSNVDVNTSRTVITITKGGYIKRTHAFIPSLNSVNYLKLMLQYKNISGTFNGASSHTVNLTDGSQVQFQSNSIVTSSGTAYTGTVTVTVKHLSESNPDFGFLIPGGDLSGRNTAGQNVALISYGMMGVFLEGSNGEALQIDSMKPATIKFPIAATQTAAAPATIPLWYLDDATGKWMEQGTATKSGNNYVGTVKHFSWWNCDHPSDRATIKGKVVDCDGNPFPNCVVTFNGVHTLITNSNGEYQGNVPTGINITIQVLAINNPLVLANSVIINVSPLTANQIYTAADIIVNCVSRVSGTLKGCNSQNINGMVVLTENNQTVSFVATTNSSFILRCEPSTQYNLTAYLSGNFFVSSSQNVTSPILGDTLNIGNIFLCGSSNNVPLNGFILSDTILATTFFAVDTIETIAQFDSTWSGNQFHISINGSIGNNRNTYTDLYIPDSLSGSYTWNNTYSFGTQILDSITGGVLYDITSNFPVCTGTTVLTEVGSVGGRIKGYYSGIVMIEINGLSIDTTIIQGKFDVLRIY